MPTLLGPISDNTVKVVGGSLFVFVLDNVRGGDSYFEFIIWAFSFVIIFLVRQNRSMSSMTNLAKQNQAFVP